MYYVRVSPPNEAFPKAREAVLKALEIAPEVAEAHYVKGLIYQDFDWDYISNRIAFEKAIQLNPNYPNVYIGYSINFNRLGNQKKALELLKKLVSMDPLSPFFNYFLATQYMTMGQYDIGIGIFKQIIEMRPAYSEAYRELGHTYSLQGKHKEAISTINQAVHLSQRNTTALGNLALAYYEAGQKREIKNIQIELDEKSKKEWVPATILAAVHFYLGEYEKSFSLLEKAYEDQENESLGWISYI